MEAREKREVSEERNGIVCKIDCVLVLSSVNLKTAGQEKRNHQPSQYPSFQSRESCALHVSKHKNDINPAHFKV